MISSSPSLWTPGQGFAASGPSASSPGAPGEPLELIVIAGSDGDRIVGWKVGVARLPGTQEPDPLVYEQVSSGEKGDHLVLVEKLGSDHAGADDYES